MKKKKYIEIKKKDIKANMNVEVDVKRSEPIESCHCGCECGFTCGVHE